MKKIIITTNSFMYQLIDMKFISDLPSGTAVEYLETEEDFGFFEGTRAEAIEFGIIFNDQN